MASNKAGVSTWSESSQISTLTASSDLPLPIAPEYHVDDHLVEFDVPLTSLKLQVRVDVKGKDGKWKEHFMALPEDGIIKLEEPADEVQIQLCLAENQRICGNIVAAQFCKYPEIKC